MLRDDIGFQLSFASILGIVYVYPIIDKILEKIKVSNIFKIRDIISVSLAAQIATGGIIAYYFGMVSLLNILANVLVIWTSAFILVFLLIAMFAGLIFESILPILFFPVKIIIDYMYFVSDKIVAIPFSYIEFNASFVGVLAYYIIVTAIIIKFSDKKNTETF